jgi:hypothetical protein
MTYDIGNQGPDLEQAQKCVNMDSNLPLLIVEFTSVIYLNTQHQH